MQNDVYNIFGISPAFFISKFGTVFASDQVESSIAAIKALGFSKIQLEIYEDSLFDDWLGGGLEKTLAELSKQEMGVSVFVGHYLGNSFSSREKLDEDKSSHSLRDLLKMIEAIEFSVPLCIPLLTYSGNVEGDRERAAEKLSKWAAIADEYHRNLILEITPASIAGTYSAFLSDGVWNGVNNKVGFLLDTGHAHIQGEDIPSLIDLMGTRLQALHVSDNDGLDNLSLPPGEGSIDWRGFLSALKKAGYTGSIDLEIAAPPEMVFEHYKQGRDYLLHLLRS